MPVVEQISLLATAPAPPLELGTRIPLSLMHFLEFAIWGAWYVVLGNYLNSLNFSRKAIGWIYSTVSFGSIIAPMLVGTIADRYFNGEHCMAVLHLVGAVLLFAMAYCKTPVTFFLVAIAYSLAYAPTLALVNSITFANIPDATRDFPMIRVLGTIGWILAGLSLKLLIKPNKPVDNKPLLLAATLSLVLGLFSFMLPETKPPAPEGGEIPFLQAFQLFSEPGFAVFFGVSFFITIALSFYFSFTALFLEQRVKVKPENIGPLMSIGQFVEIFFMFTLAWFLNKLGMKWVLTIGMAAWAIRYALFSIGNPLPVVIIGIALHGICFDFFFAAGFIYVEQEADAAIRASGQSLFAVLTYGLGMWLGTASSGWLNQRCTVVTKDPATGEDISVTDWTTFWMVPCIGVLVCLGVFFLFG